MITIRNCGSPCIAYTYVIYRVVDNENWFYGATDDLNCALEICNELGSNAHIAESEKCNCLKF